MIAAALAQVSPSLPAQPHDVGEGFARMWQSLDNWGSDFVALIPNLIVSAVVTLLFLVLAWIAAALLRHTVGRRGRHDLAYMLASLAYWSVVFLGFLVVITILLPSMHPVDIFTSLGIGSIALGFALKDLLQNWIAGFFILLRRPFHRGDQIKVGDIEGTVQAVETRATLLKTFAGRLVIIPNSEIYTRSVTVHTAYEMRRSEITVPVGLEVDLDQAIAVFREAVHGVPDVLAEPPPDVLPWDFSNNNVDIRVRWWTKPQRAYEVRTRAGVVFAIKRACEAAGIALPADTKISFAETPLFTAETTAPAAKPAPPRPAMPSDDDETLAAPSTFDQRNDPEAELPKPGELSEAADEVPR
jgi:small-conductance mechanosensitive channel